MCLCRLALENIGFVCIFGSIELAVANVLEFDWFHGRIGVWHTVCSFLWLYIVRRILKVIKS